eukprot:COSAG01_NODE_67377_length_267_cov_0.619048_1_plen_30_part_10
MHDAPVRRHHRERWGTMQLSSGEVRSHLAW